MSENHQLERFVQGAKSLGKIFWISFGISFAASGVSHYSENKDIKKYSDIISKISAAGVIAGMYKNRKKIGDCLNPNVSNKELKEKYGLTGENYIFKTD